MDDRRSSASRRIISFTLGTLIGTGDRLAPRHLGDSLLPISTFFSSVPYFWLGADRDLALLGDARLVPRQRQLRPLARARRGRGSSSARSIYYGFLPAMTIVISSIAGWILGMRNMMVTVSSEDYVTVAQAKGLSERRGDVRLRGAQRDPAAGVELRPVARLHRRRHAGHGDRLLLPGHRLLPVHRGAAQDYPLMQGSSWSSRSPCWSRTSWPTSSTRVLDPRTRQEG